MPSSGSGSGSRRSTSRIRVKSLRAGLPLDLRFRTKGELAVEICQEVAADGVTVDFACGDEVYGNCTKLREHLEAAEQAYVLRVPKSFRFTLRGGTVLTCEEAVKTLLKPPRRWEVRSAGKGSKGEPLVRMGVDRNRAPARTPCWSAGT